MCGGCFKSSLPRNRPNSASDKRSASLNGASGVTASRVSATPRPKNECCATWASSLRCTTKTTALHLNSTRTTRPSGVATYYIEPGTPPNTHEHVEDCRTTSSTPPRFYFKGSVKPLQQSQLLRRTVLNSQVTVLITHEIHEPPDDERRSIVSDQKRTIG